MPSIKRTGIKAKEVKTGFESYDGPEPHKRGMYRSKVTQAQFIQFKTGAQGYKLLLELEAEKGDPKDHAQFDGYGIWTNLVIGDKEAMITRENNFLAAIGAKDDPTVVFEDGDLEQGVKIRTIGGKNPVGQFVNADIKMGSYNGEPRPEVDGIYKLRAAGSSTTAVAAAPIEPDEDEEEEADLLEETEEVEEGEEMTAEEREEELNGYGIADLRKLAKSDYDLPTVGLKKPDLIAAILDYEYGEGTDEEAEDEEEEAEDAEVEETEDDEEEEEDDESEEEEEEEDERGEREAELSGLDRTALKVIIKGLQPEFRVLKSTTDDALREAILAEEFGDDEETPF